MVHLTMIVDEHLVQGRSVSPQPWLVGMIVFGGMDRVTGYKLNECAFSVGISREACLNAWDKVGAAPLTRKCLEDPKVSKTLGDGDVNFDEYLLSVQVANNLATHALSDGGFNGTLLKVKIVLQQKYVLVEKHLKEMIEQLANASTHGAKFLATGGYLMTDDFFIANQKNEIEKEVVELVKEKKKRLQWMKIAESGSAILENKAAIINLRMFGNLTIVDLDTLLWWLKSLGVKMLKADKVTKMMETFDSNQSPPVHETWTAEDEERLNWLKNSEIDLADTELGRKQALMKHQVLTAGADLNDDEWGQ